LPAIKLLPVPLRDTDDALFVNWCELTITNDKNKIIYRNAFATDYVLNGKNIKQIIESIDQTIQVPYEPKKLKYLGLLTKMTDPVYHAQSYV
jgi:zona occludens toxin (predicted ATPase)